MTYCLQRSSLELLYIASGNSTFTIPMTLGSLKSRQIRHRCRQPASLLTFMTVFLWGLACGGRALSCRTKPRRTQSCRTWSSYAYACIWICIIGRFESYHKRRHGWVTRCYTLLTSKRCSSLKGVLREQWHSGAWDCGCRPASTHCLISRQQHPLMLMMFIWQALIITASA